MTAAMIVLAVLLAVVLLALGLFLFACRRRPVPDFTEPAVIAKWGRKELVKVLFFAGRDACGYFGIGY